MACRDLNIHAHAYIYTLMINGMIYLIPEKNRSRLSIFSSEIFAFIAHDLVFKYLCQCVEEGCV